MAGLYIYRETNAHIDTKARCTLPFKTTSVKSELFTDLCCQWYPIQNSQLIRKYQCNDRYIEIKAHRDTEFSFTPPNVVTNNKFGMKNPHTVLLISSGWEFQFHISTDIWWSRMAIYHCYWPEVVKNGNFTLLLTSSGQE